MIGTYLLLDRKRDVTSSEERRLIDEYIARHGVRVFAMGEQSSDDAFLSRRARACVENARASQRNVFARAKASANNRRRKVVTL